MFLLFVIYICFRSGKMLLVRIIENNKIDAYLGKVKLNKDKLCPAGLGNGLG